MPATFAEGTQVTLTASPVSGSIFSSWTGADCLDGVLTMSQDRSCTAVFDLDSTGSGELIGYWALNDGTGTTALDSSGMGGDGTLTNMEPGSDWVTGSLGLALEFDGNNEYVEIEDRDDLDLAGSDFTVAAWLKPATFGESSQGRIVDHDGGSSGGGGWTFQLMDNASFVTSGLAYQVNGTSISSSNPNLITLDTWQHAAVTYDSGTLTFYVGGQPRGVRTGAPAVVATSAPIRIGMRATDSDRDFNGSIDEVRVYDRALSQAEIQDLAAPCLGSQDLVLNETVTATKVFEACNSITGGSLFTVTSTGDATFKARTKIVLDNGFQVDAGGTFVAEIDPTAGSD